MSEREGAIALRDGRITLLAVVLIGCVGPSPEAAPVEAREDPLAPLPRSYAECVRAGGEIEPQDRGGRCYAYFTKGEDMAAYARCRDAAGVPRLVGPGRSLSGQSHVCTLVFAPTE